MGVCAMAAEDYMGAIAMVTVASTSTKFGLGVKPLDTRLISCQWRSLLIDDKHI